MVLAKVGIGYHTNLDGKSAAIVGSDFIIDLWITEAEAYVNNLSRYDWVGNYASLDANDKKILQEIASCYAAIYAVNYDMGGFSSRVAAEDKINVLRERLIISLDLLKEDKTRTFLQG